MQERLKRFIEGRTQMFAAVSHDLRTPLTRLRLRAEFVEDEEQQAKMLADIEEMEAMIATTLAFAREEAADETRSAFDLAGLVRGVGEALAETGMDVTCTAPEALPFSGREQALRRALANLIDNAVKYGDRARVTLTAERAAARIVIDDDGPGIPEEQREKVFQPFYRLEASRSRETGGTGLGLAAARNAVRAHGGDVTLANRAEGGLRVTVVLPRDGHPG